MRLSDIGLKGRILGIVILGLLAAMVEHVILLPPPPHLNRDNVSLTFLGYTNGGAAGTRRAVFAVTNLADSKILVFEPYVTPTFYSVFNGVTYSMMYIPKDGGVAGTNFIPRPGVTGVSYTASNSPPFRAMLCNGASARFTIAVPTNQPAWSIVLKANSDVGIARAAIRYYTRVARRPTNSIVSDLIRNIPIPFSGVASA